MQALLLSPATTFLSPDSSSSLSPSTPPLPSLDFLNHFPHEDEPQHDDEEGDELSTGYSRAREGVETPTHAPRNKQQQPTRPPPPPTAHTRPAPTPMDRRTSIPPIPQTTPRVPSNLRYAFSRADQSTTSTSNTSSTSFTHSRSPSHTQSIVQPEENNGSLELIHFDQSQVPHLSSSDSPDVSSTSSAAPIGTFVVNSTKINDALGGAGAGPGDMDGDQLAAAIRAFRGPAQSAGLFGVGASSLEEDYEGEVSGVQEDSRAPQVGKGKALLSLFEPISPPAHVPLPRSTVPAPSLDSFSFSPPCLPSNPPPASTSTPIASINSVSSTPTVSTPSFLYDHANGSSQELTPLAIPPLVPTQTPRPFAFNRGPQAGVRTPSVQGNVDEAMTRGLIERKQEKKFLKRSIPASAPPPQSALEANEGNNVETVSTHSSSSNTTVRPPFPFASTDQEQPVPSHSAPFSIADLISSLPTQSYASQPQGEPFDQLGLGLGGGGGDYSTTQEFESARSRSQTDFQSHRNPFDNSRDGATSEEEDSEVGEGRSIQGGEDDEETTTQDGDEGEDETDNRGVGFVPPSTMTLSQLKENGFVSSSDEGAEEESDSGGEEMESTLISRGQTSRGVHVGFSSDSSEEDGEAQDTSNVNQHSNRSLRRRRGPLQSSSNAPSSNQSSFAVGSGSLHQSTLPPDPPFPDPPTLTFDHLPNSRELSHASSRRSYSSSRAPSPPPPVSTTHQFAPIASPLKLFQSTYDTYTRQHLNEIVDLVDSTNLNASTRDNMNGDEEELEFGEVEEGVEDTRGDSSEEGFLGEEGRRRSCKRIKLSPPKEYEEEDDPSDRYDSRRYDDEASRQDEVERSEEGTPIRSTAMPRRTPRTSSERRRQRDGVLRTGGRRKSDAGTPSSAPSRRRTAVTVVAEEEEDSRAADDPHTNRQERVKDRREEAMELMEKIRKRSEERENRRKSDQPNTTEPVRLRSPPKVSLLSPRARSPVASSERASGSSPPLPHLAAAASASIRSVLGSPAPSHGSPRMASARHLASPALVPTPHAKTIGLGFDKKFPSSIVKGLENGGSIGKRRFAKVPLSPTSTKTGTRDDAEENRQTRPSPFLDAVPPSPAPTSSQTQSLEHKRRSSLTTIHPSSLDAQRLLASAGSSAHSKGMVFDDQLGRWIRTPRKRVVSRGATDKVEETVQEEPEEEEEEDPFKDFSELQSPPQARQSPVITIASPERDDKPSATEATTSNDALDASPASTLSRADLDKLPLPGDGSGSIKLHHFDLSGLGISKGTPPLLAPPAKKVQPAKSPEGACYFDPHPTEAQDIGETPLLRLEEEEGDSATWGHDDTGPKVEQARPEKEEEPLRSSSTSKCFGTAPPPLASPATPLHTQHTHSAPPSTSTPFPRSALKPSRAQTDPTGFHSASTPIRANSDQSKLPRSVSFSDGKLHGKIENLERPLPWKGSRLKYEVSAASRSNSFEFGTAAGGFGELEMDDEDAEGAEQLGEVADPVTDDTPRASRVQLSSRAEEVSETSIVLSSFDSVSPGNPRSGNSSRSRTFSRTPGSRNATFLTECSFGVSHDRLLQYITDVEPFEPDWEGLRSIDLSMKKAESVVRLKEFLPKLDEANLNHNEISYLTGIPSSLRTLLIASNRLTSLTSFHHLYNLERLDISNNQLDSVEHLSALRHLRDLKADGNQISSIAGLDGLDGLVRLSLKGNQLCDEIDFTGTKWSRLETLVLSRNALSGVRGLESLESLTSLNLDHNALVVFSPNAPNSRLRILRLCNNPISRIDVSFASRLRTLYIDSARLGVVEGTEQLRKLENISLRDQSGSALTLAMPPIRDVKRLYLSGNPLPSSFPSEKFFNLTYLELAMCQLTSLPADLASLVPNVRTLNLDFNFLESLEPLSGLTRLGKLSVVGARLGKVRPVVGILETLLELESLDLRMNPITLAFYPPLGPSTDSLLPSHREHQILHPESLTRNSGALSTADSRPDFDALDSKFRKALPDEWYFKRSAYRAALMHAVPSLFKLDGIDCTKERKKLRKVVDRLRDREPGEGSRE